MTLCCKTPIWFPKDQLYFCCHVSSELQRQVGCGGWGDAEPGRMLGHGFYQGFSTHLLGAGLAGGTVWEATVFPGASMGAVPGKAPSHEH